MRTAATQAAVFFWETVVFFLKKRYNMKIDIRAVFMLPEMCPEKEGLDFK